VFLGFALDLICCGGLLDPKQIREAESRGLRQIGKQDCRNLQKSLSLKFSLFLQFLKGINQKKLKTVSFIMKRFHKKYL